MNGVREIPVAFGPAQSLFGVLSTPSSGEAGAVACLMFNVDATYRVGPRRIHVKLARQLAERGLTSLRFDLSGHGDSDVAHGAEQASTQGVHDLQAAMDRVEAMLGIHRFIVIGLRSGAHHGLGAAVADARVAGLLMFDGFAFPGRGSRWDRRVRQALAAVAQPSMAADRLRGWARAGQGRENVARGSAIGTGAALPPAPFGPERPEPAIAPFRRAMTQLAQRSVAVMLLYSGSVHVIDHGRDQLGPLAHEACMRDVQYRFAPDIDQGLTSVAAQQAFVAVVSDWVLRLANQRAPAAPGRQPLHPGTVERVVLRTA